MKELLPIDSLSYLRRLSKELKTHFVDGFYWEGQRWTGASVSNPSPKSPNACLNIYRNDGNGIPIVQKFFSIEGVIFMDPYGKEICASRQK